MRDFRFSYTCSPPTTFWNPSLPSREIATTELLTDGRLRSGSAQALLGTVAKMADPLRRNRDRYGFSYRTVHGPFREAFAPVIERLRK